MLIQGSFRGEGASQQAEGGNRAGARYAEAVDIDAGSLIAGFLVSGVGYVFFNYGRKMGRPIHLITGLLLMVYPYFIPTVWVMVLIGVLLCGLNYFAVQRGF